MSITPAQQLPLWASATGVRPENHAIRGLKTRRNSPAEYMRLLAERETAV